MHATSLIQRSLVSLPREAASARLYGRIKATPDDFRVTEVPAYAPAGAGDHVMWWLEKRDLSHFAMCDLLSRTLHVAPDDIGTAGMKDARAVTRQWISLPASPAALDPAADAALAEQGLRVLSRSRHPHKLKTGHLRGNQFDVVIREARCSAVPLPQAVAALVHHSRTRGLVNAFGSQRFGLGGATVRLGLGVLGADGVPRAGRLGKAKLRLALSAVQSALFNVFVAERLAAGTLYEPQQGDVAVVCASGGPFVVDDVDEVRARARARTVVLGGPLFGPKMRAASGPAAEHEAALLERFGLSLAMLQPFAKLVRGGRRPCVVWPEDLQASIEGEDAVRLTFFLPSGSYATELLGDWLAEPLPAA